MYIERIVIGFCCVNMKRKIEREGEREIENGKIFKNHHINLSTLNYVEVFISLNEMKRNETKRKESRKMNDFSPSSR